jgi:hypothetical protein
MHQIAQPEFVLHFWTTACHRRMLAPGSFITWENSRMSNSMQCILRIPGLLLAAVLGLTTTSATLAATESDATAGQAPVAEIQELGDVWVRGQSLSRMIEDAEDEFIRHYNKLNKNRNFDVVCDYVRLSRDSMAMTRTCLPQFLGYVRMGGGMEAVPVTGTLMCTPGTFMTTDTGTYYSSGICSPAFRPFSGYYSSGYYSGYPTYGGNSTPSAPAVMRWPENSQTSRQRQEYARTLMRIIYSDQQLLEKATTLAGLYGEMRTIQDQYQMVKAEEDARKEAARREKREQRGRNSARSPRDNNPRL